MTPLNLALAVFLFLINDVKSVVSSIFGKSFVRELISSGLHLRKRTAPWISLTSELRIPNLSIFTDWDNKFLSNFLYSVWLQLTIS